MYHLHPDTLEYFKEKPLFRHKNVKNIPVTDCVTAMRTYFQNIQEVETNVEVQALTFYLLNHANALLLKTLDPQEVMHESQTKLARLYTKKASEITERLMYYVLLITTRESRHAYKGENFYTKLTKEFGESFTKWYKEIPSGSSAAASHIRNKPPKGVTLGTYTTALTYIFNTGQFSGGYGGKPWANIADTLRALVHGETTPEMFCDTAWTLAHNNGPMFNKGMLYGHQDTHLLIKILDVQRAGMIPKFVYENYKGKEIFDDILSQGAQLFPEDFTGYVDWYAVEALGATKTYSSEKSKQKAMYGESPLQPKPVIPEVPKLYILGNEYATIISRKELTYV